MVLNKFEIDIAIFNKASSYGVKQDRVGAGPELQMQVGQATRIGDPGVDNNHFNVRVLFFVLLKSAKKDGVAPGRIGSCNEEAVGQFNVFVGDGH